MSCCQLSTRSLLSIALTLFIMVTTALAKYSGGTGDPNAPYQIATAEDLIDLGHEPNDYDKHFILTADVSLVGLVFDDAVVAPDSDSYVYGKFAGTPFSGHFDGQRHLIHHLQIQGRYHKCVGLFGGLSSSGVIINLGLDTVNIVTDEQEGYGSTDIGGLVGHNNGGTISNCHSSGTVRGTSTIGGLIGYNKYGYISHCHSTCTVRGQYSVGGLVGGNNGHICYSYSSGAVRGEKEMAGGLVGAHQYGSLLSCCSSSSVHGLDDVGGLIGVMAHNCNVMNCYSTGNVNGHGYIGGLVGIVKGGFISNCYSIGRVSGYWEVGGLVGGWDGNPSFSSVHRSYWNTQTSGQGSVFDAGLTTTEMQETDVYLDAGWDLTDEKKNGTCDYWLCKKGSYPTLAALSGIIPVEPNGAGTREVPYLITDVNELGSVCYRYLAHYRLDSNLDLSGITWSTAVIPLFCGRFDGNGHTIDNLSIRGLNYLGLFGVLDNGALVTGLGLETVDVGSLRLDSTGYPVGGLVAYSRLGHVSDCHVSGLVTSYCYVGGIVGLNGSRSNRISNSFNTCTVAGEYDAGGLVGYNYGELSTSHNAGIVDGRSRVGGLVGYNDGAIRDCYSDGAVEGESTVGGLVGQNDGTVSNCYNAGAVTGKTEASSLVGRNQDGSTSNTFWVCTSGQDSDTGCNSPEQMKQISLYLNAGWDFIGETDNGTDDIWWINEGLDYPRLWWEKAAETDEP